MRSERYVFNTPPYSGHIKQFWRFKDEHAARASCDTIWAIFERYADMDDFVGCVWASSQESGVCCKRRVARSQRSGTTMARADDADSR